MFSFVTETALNSEQITDCRLGGLLEINDKSSSKLIFLSYIIWQCWPRIFEITILYEKVTIKISLDLYCHPLIIE